MSIFAPVQLFADWLTFGVFALTPKTHLADAVNFFVFDTIKILLLLLVSIFFISLVRTFLPPERIRVFLSRGNQYVGNVLAALLGIITPFCSCSAVPLFLGFVEAGVPLGVTFSFLVASPMINEVAVVMLLGMFGWKITVLYIGSGLLVAIVSGIVIGALKLEHLVVRFPTKRKTTVITGSLFLTWTDRASYAWQYTLEIIGKIWIYVLVGIGIGAWIHGYVPADFLAQYAGADKWYAVPLATAIGVPLYSNAAGVLPLVSVLMEKGVSIGTTLAFMMAVTALSLPEFLILKRVMKTKLLLIFATVVWIGIMLVGYLFNFLLA